MVVSPGHKMPAFAGPAGWLVSTRLPYTARLPAITATTTMSIYRQTLIDGLWRNNPGLVQFLGICPLLAVSNTLVNGLGLGLATTAVLICSNLLVSLAAALGSRGCAAARLRADHRSARDRRRTRRQSLVFRPLAQPWHLSAANRDQLRNPCTGRKFCFTAAAVAGCRRRFCAGHRLYECARAARCAPRNHWLWHFVC